MGNCAYIRTPFPTWISTPREATIATLVQTSLLWLFEYRIPRGQFGICNLYPPPLLQEWSPLWHILWGSMLHNAIYTPHPSYRNGHNAILPPPSHRYRGVNVAYANWTPPSYRNGHHCDRYCGGQCCIYAICSSTVTAGSSKFFLWSLIAIVLSSLRIAAQSLLNHFFLIFVFFFDKPFLDLDLKP